MATGYTLLLKNKKMSEDILINKIKSLGYTCNKYERLTKGICINLDDEIGFSVFLLDSGNYPYNIWETKFLENDFLSKRILELRMVKDFCEYEKCYEVIFKIIFDLSLELNEEAILISNGDIELCFFRENKKIFLNNESGIWDNDCFKESIKNRDVCYI